MSIKNSNPQALLGSALVLKQMLMCEQNFSEQADQEADQVQVPNIFPSAAIVLLGICSDQNSFAT